MSELMDIILDCENRLGWCPPERVALWRARAIEHRKLTQAMERHGYTEDDLRLALAYCVRRRQPINSPLELIGLVDPARALAAAPEHQQPLEEQLRTAIDWELSEQAPDWELWCRRLVRTAAHLRGDVLSEWREAGRG